MATSPLTSRWAASTSLASRLTTSCLRVAEAAVVKQTRQVQELLQGDKVVEEVVVPLLEAQAVLILVAVLVDGLVYKVVAVELVVAA